MNRTSLLLLVLPPILLLGAEKTFAGDTDGRATYERNCATCHATGVGGAPTLLDKTLWAPRLKQDKHVLYASAFQGRNAMPPKGGNPALTYVEVEQAVDYMISKIGDATVASSPTATIGAAKSDEAEARTDADTKTTDKDRGKSTYDTTCATCHATGLAGAPKSGDAAAWSPRIAAGTDSLYASALKGKGAMPPRGGNPTLTDEGVKAAVNYMVANAGASQPAATQEAKAKPEARSTETATAPKAGRLVYQATCAACHAAGLAGAPKLGDAEAWAPRVKVGTAALYRSALKGKNAMPAKGGNAELADEEVKAAVDFMVARAKGARASKPSAAVPQTAATGANPIVAAKSDSESDKGKSTYQSICAACHASGLAGAPKYGDKDAWSPRLAGGIEALYASAIKGKNAMPAKGGNGALADAEVKTAVDYLVLGVRARVAKEQTAKVPSTTAIEATDGTSAEAAKSASATDIADAKAYAPQYSGASRASQSIEPKASSPAAAPAQPTVSAAADPNSFNRLLRPIGKRNLPPAEDNIHDATNDGTHMLQAPLASFQAFPKGNAGNQVDWVKALNEGKINPRGDKTDPAVEMLVLDMNIVREVKGSMPDVVYPHKQHTQWLDCSNCHPAIFIPQKGANQMSMAGILLGQKCGVCHGKVAFPVSECRLCHSKNKETKTSEAKQ